MSPNQPVDAIHAASEEIRKTDAFTRYLQEVSFYDIPSEATGDLDPETTDPVIALLSELVAD